MRRWYGAGPLHLLAFLASFALAGYAALKLFGGNPVGVGIWFVGCIVGHDLLLFPLYALADSSLVAVLRRRPAAATVPWVNHVRFPAVVSGILLLVWAPLVFRLSVGYESITSLTTEPYLERWLAVTGVLFAASAALYALRLRAARRPQPARRPG
ncbi:MAG: hypothetical protein M3R63_17390 [Actinomycetota bacterium]|nr:hypothetical protein [Actinomycetota bacterium]